MNNPFRSLVLATSILLPLAGAGAASTSQAIHRFACSGGDGSTPTGSLAGDSVGNLFGATVYGGAGSVGSVYRLYPKAGAMTWNEGVIYSFKLDGVDGINPEAGLLVHNPGAPGEASEIFGTTSAGGKTGAGTVFMLKRGPTGWTETVIHSFANDGVDGASPQAALIEDSAGVLYGTTSAGGVGAGTVFSLTPNANRTAWQEKVIYAFPADGGAGSSPLAALIQDPATGIFYGTTELGGAHNNGAAFALSQSGGVWSERVIYSFANGNDGYYPVAGLTEDANGVFYGTLAGGGNNYSGSGLVFSLTPDSGTPPNYTESILTTFTGGSNGASPYAGVTWADGALYGTTLNGGDGDGGVIFGLKPPSKAGGTWKIDNQHLMHRAIDGANPRGGGLTTNPVVAGLFGAASQGGLGCGTVFRFTHR